ncbi:MAG: hypothetical protein GX270_15965, partial [Clostridiaceae bacterium]|nr:hypothetical protein [Clostridiaceae bacterium]
EVESRGRQVGWFVGKPDESKGSCPVWSRGKARDHFKGLPMAMQILSVKSLE